MNFKLAFVSGVVKIRWRHDLSVFPNPKKAARHVVLEGDVIIKRLVQAETAGVISQSLKSTQKFQQQIFLDTLEHFRHSRLFYIVIFINHILVLFHVQIGPFVITITMFVALTSLTCTNITLTFTQGICFL